MDRARARAVRRALLDERATTAVAKAVERRSRSARELDALLERRGEAPATRGTALERLVAAGVIDDSRLARASAESLAARGWGDAAVRHRLESRGIPEQLVGQALAELAPERLRAEAALARTPGRDPRRLAAFLARRGFSDETIADVLGHVGDE